MVKDLIIVKVGIYTKLKPRKISNVKIPNMEKPPFIELRSKWKRNMLQ
jgi:hypothetical protein